MIRILVVDDNALMRLGLTEAIGIEPELEVAGEAASGAEALEVFRRVNPDVITMDYQMPGGESGIECTKKIMAEDPHAKVILLSVFDSEEDIYLAKQAGVKGYLTKKAGGVRDVIGAIQEVASGGTYFPAQIATKLNNRLKQPDLTKREMQVLKLLAEGNSNKEIGDILSISLATVKLHIANLREKLGASDRTQAVVFAYKRGILHLDD
ncbi:response regulator transcription factor [Pontiella agarivorans]|uniref:Response regulator transcription factor n=1 Tax=Pontiella agarivorans TaxID=3038953 RepID=A0ABU5MTR5_9BACT|nr:response regulator transcription factor [Pontiella agarivorans]MDZ8117481.1 response regulator transcription factor [Pontiella agarivorans]